MLRINNYRVRALGQTAPIVLPPTASTTPASASAAPAAPAPDVVVAAPTPSGPSWLPASLRGIDWLKAGAWGAGIGVAVILLTKFMGGKKKETAPPAATIVIPQSSSPVVVPSSSSVARELRSWG